MSNKNLKPGRNADADESSINDHNPTQDDLAAAYIYYAEHAMDIPEDLKAHKPKDWTGEEEKEAYLEEMWNYSAHYTTEGTDPKDGRQIMRPFDKGKDDIKKAEFILTGRASYEADWYMEGHEEDGS
jgi:hypothetical protein